MTQQKLQPTCETTTEMVFILDRSGSMQGLEKDTIGGFNSLIAKQKEEPGSAFVTTVLFDHRVEMITSRKPLNEVSPLTKKEYYVRGCTALLDAIGSTIKHIRKQQKQDKNKPDQTVFVIITDGYENASTEYSLEKVKSMIEKRQQKDGWEFVFLGANIDAIETAGSLGIAADRASAYVADSDCTRLSYETISDEVLSPLRVCAAPSVDWNASLEEYVQTHSSDA